MDGAPFMTPHLAEDLSGWGIPQSDRCFRFLSFEEVG